MKIYSISPYHIPENMLLYGLLPDLSRMPRKAAADVSNAVAELSLCPAGGRVKFTTDSRFISISVFLTQANCNSACDVLSDGVYCGKIGGCEEDVTYNGTLRLAPDGDCSRAMRTVTVFMPRTAPLAEMQIFLEDGAHVEKPAPYNHEKPLVFYGSSITMGAASASPSKAYTALVSERLGYNHINLGFGGNAKGELAMAEYIASLDMSAFVLDYEHNADTLDCLRATHKPFFDTIRAAQPKLPILIISRPDTDREFLRSCYGRRIIMDTFHAALDAGDRLVDYVDGFYLWGNNNRHLCCIGDGCHPNELGFEKMAETLAPRLHALLNRNSYEDTMGHDGSDADFPTHI